MSPFSIVLITLGVSVLGIIGGLFMFWKEQLVRKWSPFLLSFAAGSLLGATFIELFPEAIEHAGEEVHPLVYAILVGILFFFALEKLLVWHHHSHEHHEEEGESAHFHSLTSARPLIILGDALHNLLDGAIIAAAFLTDPALGWITALAVVAHEIPQEIGDFAVLLHSGMSRMKVLFWNLMHAVVSPIGAILVLAAESIFENIEGPLLGFIIGNFIYIALADLVPTIQHERRLARSLVQIFLILLGVGVFWQLGILLPHEHS